MYRMKKEKKSVALKKKKMQAGDEVSIDTLTQESGAETVVSDLEKETLDEKRARNIREREQARRAREQKELEEYKARRAREKKEEAENVASKEKEAEPEDAQPEAEDAQPEHDEQNEANELDDALAKIDDDVKAGKMSRRQARSARVKLLMADMSKGDMSKGDMSKGDMSKGDMSKEELFRWKQNIQRTEHATGKRLVHVRRRFNKLL